MVLRGGFEHQTTNGDEAEPGNDDKGEHVMDRQIFLWQDGSTGEGYLMAQVAARTG